MAETTISDKLVVEIGGDISGLSQSLSRAGRDVNAFAGGTVASAARDMSRAFDGTARSLETGLVRAARTGKFSIGSMVDSIDADLARMTVQRYIAAPIEKAANSLANSLGSIISGRALGGPVGAGNAYLVGERGPELFVPSGNGEVVPGARGPGRPQIVVNIQTPDARSFLHSETQIAAMLTRAVSRGTRNI
jgi:phage-related minor tail protein